MAGGKGGAVASPAAHCGAGAGGVEAPDRFDKSKAPRMNTLIVVVGLVTMVLQWLIWALVIWAVLSWLVAFNVVNLQNGFVRGVVQGLDRFFNPILRPIRRLLPDMGGIDLAPMVLILLIMLVQRGLPAILLDTGMLAAA